MKKSGLFVGLLCLFMLTSCGNGNNISNISADSTASDSSSTSEIVEPQNISDVRNGTPGNKYTIEGVVVAYNYTGQETPYITGVWIADETSSIYVYGEAFAKSLTVGAKIRLSGTFAYYIPSTDSTSAVSTNYVGMIQLTDPIIEKTYDGTFDIPAGSINTSTVMDINAIPLTNNITGLIYKVKGHYHKYEMTGFTNYEIEDLNRVDTLLAYTQSNGKDYAWTDAYDSKTVEMLIVVTIGKPSLGLWRITPIKVLSDAVVVTDEEEAGYAANRALSKFVAKYDTQTSVKIPLIDEKYTAATIAISSTATDYVNITSDSTNTTVKILSSKLGSFVLTVSATVNASTVNKNMSIEVVEPPHFDTISIAEALATSDGTSVCVEAIIARITFKSGGVKQGMFIVDSSGTAFVYNGTETQANLADLVNGNKVIITGVMTHFIKNADYATAQNYTGDRQITEVVVNHIDSNVYPLPTTHFVDSTIENLAAITPATNITETFIKYLAH